MNKQKIIKFMPSFLVFTVISLALALGVNYVIESRKIENEIKSESQKIEDKRKLIEDKRKLAISWLNNTNSSFFEEKFNNLFSDDNDGSVFNYMDNLVKQLSKETKDYPNYTKYIDYPKETEANKQEIENSQDECKIAQDMDKGKNVEYTEKWKIPLFDQDRDVNYKYGILRDFNNSNSNNKSSSLTKNDCKVFGNFMGFLYKEKSVINPKLKIINSIKDFDTYSEEISNKLLDKDDITFNLIKPYIIYVARIDKKEQTGEINGKMLTYVSWNINIPIDSPDKRPWGQAVEGSFPSNFKNNSTNPTFGLTHSYVTNRKDDRQANIIKTAWYVFNHGNNRYVLCIDLFFDTTELYPLNKQEQNTITNSVWGKILVPKRFVLSSLIPSLFLGALTTLLYRSKKRDLQRWILKDFDINSPQYSEIYLEREHKYIADTNEGKVETSVESNVIISQANRSEESQKQGWSAEVVTTTDILNVNANVATERIDTNTNLQQNQEIKKYKIYKTYNLKIETIDSRLKCVELWKAKLKGENTNNIKEIGNFYIEWNNNRSIDSEQDLYIDYHVWSGQYNNIRESIKEQLFCHLLESENRSFIPVRDPDYKSTRQQNILEIIPEILRTKLEQINEIKQLIQQRRINLSLQQRKVALREYDDVLKIYSLPEINALCCVRFIKKLQSENKLQDWLNNFSQDTIILLVENTSNEFGEFYQNLADDNANNELCSTLNNNQTNIRIVVYRENRNSVINPQDNFCIVKINNNPSLIMYTPTDEPDGTDTIGWISWRKVDINFYTELYNIQKNLLGRENYSVTSYLGN